MIVRILHDGQYEIPQDLEIRLEDMDAELTLALDNDDKQAYESKLAEIINAITAEGEKVPPEKLLPSDITVPAPGSSLEDIKALLSDDDSSR
ncbi:MAG: hypothetical protein M1374_03090 [Firmicutes bacterium]|jgi:hypothetical protein|nr:hypothetical protein [Bacillota bacterium]